jgi:hypothetical protein
VDEILNHRRVTFFVLASNHHSCDAQQLVLPTCNKTVLEETINQIDCNEQGLWQQLELKVDFDEPAMQDATHFLCDFCLERGDALAAHKLGFCREHVSRAISGYFRDCLCVHHLKQIRLS